MAATIRVDVVSPEKVLFSGEATQVITRTLSGELAFLAGHAPFLGALAENHTRIYLTDGKIQDVAVHRGFVEVSHDTVSILSDTAELGEEIDIDRARAARERAEPDARRGDDDAVAALRRATARLSAAGAPATPR